MNVRTHCLFLEKSGALDVVELDDNMRRAMSVQRASPVELGGGGFETEVKLFHRHRIALKPHNLSVIIFLEA